MSAGDTARNDQAAAAAESQVLLGTLLSPLPLAATAVNSPGPIQVLLRAWREHLLADTLTTCGCSPRPMAGALAVPGVVSCFACDALAPDALPGRCDACRRSTEIFYPVTYPVRAVIIAGHVCRDCLTAAQTLVLGPGLGT